VEGVRGRIPLEWNSQSFIRSVDGWFFLRLSVSLIKTRRRHD
jgi:hypothetical protein